MAGKDKTTAWENLKWIKAHLPSWERKGMSEKFLKSVISPKYKGCEVDVGSAITCDVYSFETLYNQPDFLEKLKEICKKFKMPYGKVPKEDEEKANEDMLIELKDFGRNYQNARADKGKEHKRVYNLQRRLDEIGYKIDNRVANLDELEKIIKDRQEECIKKNGKKTGIARYCWSPLLIELYIDFVEKGYDKYKMADVLGQGYETPPKYIAELKASNIIVNPSARFNSTNYMANEEIVKFVNGRKRAKYVPDWDW